MMGLTEGGSGGLAHEGMDDKFFEWWDERKSMMQKRGMFSFILFDTCGSMKKMHVREKVCEWKEEEKQA